MKRANDCFEKARGYAEPQQAEAIDRQHGHARLIWRKTVASCGLDRLAIARKSDQVDADGAADRFQTQHPRRFGQGFEVGAHDGRGGWSRGARPIDVHAGQGAGRLDIQGDSAGQRMSDGEGGVFRLVGRFARPGAADNVCARRERPEPRLKARPILQPLGRPRRGADQPGDGGLVGPGLGGDLDFDGRAAMRLDVLGQRQHRLLPLAQRQAGQAQARRHLLDPRAMALADSRTGPNPLPLDHQPLGPAVQGDHAPRLAWALVEEQPPPAHGRRKPSPSSRARVS